MTTAITIDFATVAANATTLHRVLNKTILLPAKASFNDLAADRNLLPYTESSFPPGDIHDTLVASASGTLIGKDGLKTAIKIYLELFQRWEEVELNVTLAPSLPLGVYLKLELSIDFLKVNGDVGLSFECNTEKAIKSEGDTKVLYTEKRSINDVSLVDHIFPPEFLTSAGEVTVVFKGDLFIANTRKELMSFLLKDGITKLNFCSLLETGKYSDLVIHVARRKFHTHKAILSVASPVFAKIFDTNLVKGSLEIDDLDVATVEHMLKFIYSGIIDLANYPPLPVDLFIASDKYELDYLKAKLEDVFCLRVNGYTKAEEIIKLFQIAEKVNAHKLKSKCTDFMHSKMTQMMASMSEKNLLQMFQLMVRLEEKSEAKR